VLAVTLAGHIAISTIVSLTVVLHIDNVDTIDDVADGTV
jgi:hypothetical protein